MRIIAKRALVEFYTKEPKSRVALEDWYEKTKKAVYIKFVGSHSEYDKIKDIKNI